MGKQWKQWQTLLSCTPKSLQVVTAVMKLRRLLLGRKSYDKPRQCVKKQRHHFAYKGPCSQDYGLSSSHVQMWELKYKDRVPKNWCLAIVVLEKTAESPLNCKEIKTVNLKGNQPWIFFGRTDAEAGAPILWPPDANTQLIGKDPDSGKDWRQKDKSATDDEMLGRHH